MEFYSSLNLDDGIKFLCVDNIRGQIILRQKIRIQNDLLLGERKKHFGLYKQKHNLEHVWSNFLAFPIMSKDKLHPILQNSLPGNCGLDDVNGKKSRNDDLKCFS